MKKFRIVLSISLILAIALTFIAGNFLVSPIPVSAHNGNPHLVKTFAGPDGKEIDQLIFPAKPPSVKEKTVKVSQQNVQMGVNSSTVPAFYWSYGCSATSAAMLFGYYDLNGYNNMYTGPTNDGSCPLTNSVWGTTAYPSVTCGECPLSATHLNVDSRSSMGHVDDYWIDYGNIGPDPYTTNNWQEHATSDCTGDFMGTNQSKYSNSDGSTTFYFYTDGSPLYDYSGSEPSSRDGGHGMKLFAQSRGYAVTTTFNQYIKGQGSDRTKGFTFANYTSEIDAGRPVLIQVSGHTMLGFGYNTIGNTVYLHDTWDYNNHSMTWGGSYAGMQQYGVTVLRLVSVNPNPAPAVTINQASGQSDPTNAYPINFTVVFSQSVSGFATGDVNITGTAPGTKTGTVTGSGTTYNVAVSGMTGSGTVIANVPAGVAYNSSNVANSASTSTDNSVTFNVSINPAPTLSQITPSQGKRKQTLNNVVITGTNLSGATKVDFGSGITVKTFTVNGPTQITASISISNSATIGTRNVLVTTPGGIGTLVSGFAVVR